MQEITISFLGKTYFEIINLEGLKPLKLILYFQSMIRRGYEDEKYCVRSTPDQQIIRGSEIVGTPTI